MAPVEWKGVDGFKTRLEPTEFSCQEIGEAAGIVVDSVDSEVGPELKIVSPPHTSHLSSVTQFPNLENGDIDRGHKEQVIRIINLIGFLTGIHNTYSISAQYRPLGDDRYVAAESGSMTVFVDFDQQSQSREQWSRAELSASTRVLDTGEQKYPRIQSLEGEQLDIEPCM